MSVRVNGNIRKHQAASGETCPGSGHRPAVIIPRDPVLRRLILAARNLRLLAEQRLTEAALAHRIEQQRITEQMAHFATCSHAPHAYIWPASLSAEDNVMFTHPDLIDIDLADAYWRP